MHSVLSDLDVYLKDTFGIENYKVRYTDKLYIDLPEIKYFPMEKLYDFMNAVNGVIREYNKRSVRNDKDIIVVDGGIL